MKKFFNEYIHISNRGKLSEKVFLFRIALSVTLMVVCMIAMSLTAYAYFSCSVSTANITIQSADFDAEITANSATETLEVTAIEKNTYRATLKANTEYTVSLSRTGTAQTGFCIINIDGCDTAYITEQISTEPISFKITVSSECTVTFFTHWGTSSDYTEYRDYDKVSQNYIISGEEIEIVFPEDVKQNTTSSAETLEETTSSQNETSSQTQSSPQTSAEPQTTSSEETVTDNSSQPEETDSSTESGTSTESATDNSANSNDTPESDSSNISQ